MENEEDGTYKLYGADRTYFVTMTPAREFAALLSIVDARCSAVRNQFAR